MKNFYDFVSISILAVLFSMFFNNNIANANVIVTDDTNGYELTVTQDKNGTKVLWNDKTYGWYDFNGKVKIIAEKKLTNRMLRTRKNKVLYIEKIVGRVVNKSLDGRTTSNKYISYRCLGHKVKRGDKIVTYLVYSPYTRWIDDVVLRFDVPLKYNR